MTNTNAILKPETVSLEMAPSPNHLKSAVRDDHSQWDAVVNRDATHDGEFFFAVATTGVYCRPSCPARRPRRENVTFFGVLKMPKRPGSAPVCVAVRNRPWAMPRP